MSNVMSLSAIETTLGRVIDDCLVVCNAHLDKLMSGLAALDAITIVFAVYRENRK